MSFNNYLCKYSKFVSWQINQSVKNKLTFDFEIDGVLPKDELEDFFMGRVLHWKAVDPDDLVANLKKTNHWDEPLFHTFFLANIYEKVKEGEHREGGEA